MQSLRARIETKASRPWPDRPVPIALVITDLDVGGAERAMVALATGLDRRRWSPSVVCLGPEGVLAETLKRGGIAVACLDVPRSPARAVWSLGRALRRIRPMLVQSFLFHANIAAKLAAPLAGRPWVVGGMRVAERRNRWHLAIERRLQRLSCGTVCVSEGVRRHALEGGLDADRLAVVANGIDADRFDRPLAPVALPVPDGRKIALFVGRIEPQKGVSILLDAFGRVASDHPEWSLAIVGDGPNSSELRSRTDSADRVSWLGRRGDVDSLLLASDLLVLPSLWEGMPNVVLEAMAARRAVVGTRVEGTEDLVIDHGPDASGWLAEPGDPASLAVALDAAMGSDDERKARGQRGRARVERDFAPGRVVAAYSAIWAACLGFDPRGLKD